MKMGSTIALISSGETLESESVGGCQHQYVKATKELYSHTKHSGMDILTNPIYVYGRIILHQRPKISTYPSRQPGSILIFSPSPHSSMSEYDAAADPDGQGRLRPCQSPVHSYPAPQTFLASH